MKLSFECDMRWDQLTGGGDRKRFCPSCEHPVYNLSGMTRGQARRLLAENAHKPPCVRFVTRGGGIVHDGDPLAQLREQRRGLQTLIGAALVVHLGVLAVVDDPTAAMWGPLLLFSSCPPVPGGEVAGGISSSSIDIYLELRPCDGRAECLAEARMAYARAAAITGDAPGVPFMRLKELQIVGGYIARAGLATPPEDMADFDTLLLDAEEDVELIASEFRIRHHQLEQRKRFADMAVNVREWQAQFPDRRNVWFQEAIEVERRMKDKGTWPANFANSPPAR